MGYYWLMSDIVKNSFFLFEGTTYNEQVTNVLFSFPAWVHTVHRRLVSKKIGKCDGGIGLGLWTLVCLDGQWFGQDTVQLTKEAINFNTTHILNSFRVRSFFSNFLYTIKKLTRATLSRSKNKQRESRNFNLLSSWYVGMLSSADPSSKLHSFCCCMN